MRLLVPKVQPPIGMNSEFTTSHRQSSTADLRVRPLLVGLGENLNLTPTI